MQFIVEQDLLATLSCDMRSALQTKCKCNIAFAEQMLPNIHESTHNNAGA